MRKTYFRDTCWPRLVRILHFIRTGKLRDIRGNSVTENIEIEFAHCQTAQTGLFVPTVDTLHVLCNIPMTNLWTGVRGCEVIEYRFLGFSDIDIYTCVCVCVSARTCQGKSRIKNEFCRKRNCESNIKCIYIYGKIPV